MLHTHVTEAAQLTFMYHAGPKTGFWSPNAEYTVEIHRLKNY